MEPEIIKCAFCKGKGKNPHFRGTCPVCKGRGKNQVSGKYMTCGDCRGSGQKRGTTLTCYDCGGLGVVPDTRETFIRAREEIKEAREEIAREAEELTEKPKNKKHKLFDMFSKRKEKGDTWREEKDEEESGAKTHFCQCCASEVDESIQIKVCRACFGKMKEIA